MKKAHVQSVAAIGSLLALGSLTTTAPAGAADSAELEKCYGIVKAGKNDCAGTTHSCSGQSKQDAGAREWIALPKGTCERIVGGHTTAPK
jgi:uncharacterized membrane protein